MGRQWQYVEVLKKAYVWNPNNLLPGPPPHLRNNDPGCSIDTEILNKWPFKYRGIVYKSPNVSEQLTRIRSQDVRETTWRQDSTGKFDFAPNTYGQSGVSYFPFCKSWFKKMQSNNEKLRYSSIDVFF